MVPPQRLAKWTGLAYAAGVAALLFASADGPEVLLAMPLLLPWIVGPAALAAIAADVSQGRAGAWAFLGLEAGLILSTIGSWLYLVFVARDAQNGFVMSLSIPFFQYLAAGGFFLLALAFGWRADRQAFRDAPKEKGPPQGALP
jgi:hypothetical protein